MLDAVGGSIDMAVDDAISGASTTADLAKANGVIASEGASIANQLDSALASGDGAAVRVELVALYDFFHQLKAVYQHLDEAHSMLRKSVDAKVLLTSVSITVDGAFGDGIPGINSALQAAEQTVIGQGRGLAGAFASLKNILARNMKAVSDTYTTYMAADEEGRTALTSAAKGHLTRDWKAVDPQTSYGELGGGKVTFV